MTDSPHASIITPTFREVDSLPHLIPAVDEAMEAAGLSYELIVVDDDSQDGTAALIDRLADQYPLQLIVRRDARGLSSAVLAGFHQARGTALVCMDADLSHPPDRLANLIAPILRDEADFVVGSRYVEGGSTDADWGVRRWLNSKVATWCARPLTAIRDPMSGFFALPRNAFERARDIEPIGYKIGLELLVKTDARRVREVPIHFADRRYGESKLGLREQLNYLRHVTRLMRYRVRRGGRGANNDVESPLDTGK